MNPPEEKEQIEARDSGFVHPNSHPPSGDTLIPASVAVSFLLLGGAAFAFYRVFQGSEAAMLLKMVGSLCGVLGAAIVWRCRDELLDFFRSLKSYDPTNPFDRRNW